MHVQSKRPAVSDLKVAIFADGADISGMLEMYPNPLIKGFTTNPTLMCKAGIADYAAFAAEVVQAIPDRPISFEVLADDLPEMERQALAISRWGKNVNVKIPVTTTLGESTAAIVHRLSRQGVNLNVTALTTLAQVKTVAEAAGGGAPCYISVFAGRVADTGVDPLPVMSDAVRVLAKHGTNLELIWASPRELLNIFQADAIGCQVITVTNDILKKLSLVGRDLDEYSLDTVKMFRTDAIASGFTVP
jgi:transaldolase